jgi:AcrR family transcriptional regulator
MQDLAEHLGITKPTLYQHAGSKGDILVGIIDAFTEEAGRRLDDALQAGPDRLDWLPRLIENWLSLAGEMRPHLRIWDGEQKELGQADREQLRRWSQGIEARVREAVSVSQASGLMRDDLPASAIALALLSLMNWTARSLPARGDLSSSEIVASYTSIVLTGVGR